MDEAALRADIQRARELAQGLGPDRMQALADAQRPNVAEWRWADAYSVPHRPEPWLAITDNHRGGWRESGADYTMRIGLYDQGRPLLAELQTPGNFSPAEVWEHHDDEWRVFEQSPARSRATILRGPPGPVEIVVWSEDAGTRSGVTRWLRREGEPVRGEHAEVSVDGWVAARAFEVHLDDAGELELLAAGSADSEIEEHTRVPAERVVDALIEALEHAGDIEAFDPLWQADLHRPGPDLRPTSELVETLTAGLADAIDDAVSATHLARPFVLQYRLGPTDGLVETHLPGWLRIGSESFRDQMRRFSSTDGDAVSQLWKGEDSGFVSRVDVSGFCDPDTLRACREINTALALSRSYGDPDQQRARTALGALGARLAAELNREGRYPGVADPFLVLVEVGDPYDDTDGLTRARSAIGRERVERFVASLATQVAEAGPPPGDVRQDRDALTAWLTDRGLAEHAQPIAHAAQHSLRLVPATGTNTRLGGDGLLPAGAAWPRTSAGRPLAFLAALDLAELPSEGRLPDAGWLLFFADLDDQGEALGFIGEPTLNAPGADAQVLWTTEPPADAEPPADLPDEPHIRLPEMRVAPRPQLTLEDGYESAEALGLDPAEAEAYDEIANALRFADEDASDDWVLGAVTGVQGHSPEEETALLLHLASIEFQDAGAIQFRIPEAALVARDWSQICAEGDSA